MTQLLSKIICTMAEGEATEKLVYKTVKELPVIAGDEPDGPYSGPGDVYLIQQSGTNYYKVGRSRNPDNRLRDLQTGNPMELGMVSISVTDMVAAERELKAAMNKNFEGNLGGGTEWIKGDRKKVEKIFNKIAKKYAC